MYARILKVPVLDWESPILHLRGNLLWGHAIFTFVLVGLCASFFFLLPRKHRDLPPQPLK